MELEHNILRFGVLGCLDLTPTKMRDFGLWVLNIGCYLQDELVMHEVRTKFFALGAEHTSTSRLQRMRSDFSTADDDSAGV